jgi:hypothetical protein
VARNLISVVDDAPDKQIATGFGKDCRAATRDGTLTNRDVKGDLQMKRKGTCR